MTKPFWTALGGNFLITACFAVLWHVILFEQPFQELGVYTRMSDPIYAFGFAAWAVEALALSLIYFRLDWRNASLLEALKTAWLVGLYSSASALFGIAAKVEISDLPQWFLLTGGFIVLHTSLLGLWLGFVSKRFSSAAGQNPVISHSI